VENATRFSIVQLLCNRNVLKREFAEDWIKIADESTAIYSRGQMLLCEKRHVKHKWNINIHR